MLPTICILSHLFPKGSYGKAREQEDVKNGFAGPEQMIQLIHLFSPKASSTCSYLRLQGVPNSVHPLHSVATTIPASSGYEKEMWQKMKCWSSLEMEQITKEGCGFYLTWDLQPLGRFPAICRVELDDLVGTFKLYEAVILEKGKWNLLEHWRWSSLLFSFPSQFFFIPLSLFNSRICCSR